MDPITLDQLIALAAMAVSAITLVVGFVRSGHQAAADSQRISDQLATIRETTERTAEKMDDLDVKIDDHTGRLARAEQDVINLRARVDRIEQRCDRHFGNSTN